MRNYFLQPGKKAYFLSDLHLGAHYFDSPIEAERRVVRFLSGIAHKADIIFLVGDVLDYWYEYKYVVPRGFVRFFGKLAELADAGVQIVWLIGNHDIWIFDYLPKELGIRVVDGVEDCKIDGQRFFITHGDAIDGDSRSFRFLRSLFRNRLCQRLFAGIHPRWTIPFAFGWSNKSRHNEKHAMVCANPDRLKRFSIEKLKTEPDINFFIYGHLHILVEEIVSPDSKMVILGEWINRCSYAEFDGKTLTVKEYKT